MEERIKPLYDADEIPLADKPVPSDIPIVNQPRNDNNDSLLSRATPAPSPTEDEDEEESGNVGGGGSSSIQSYENIEIPQIKNNTYIKKVGRKYEFKFRNADGVKYDTFFEAQQARDKFIKDNNIKFKGKKS